MSLLYRLDRAAPEIARIFRADPGADPWAGSYVAPGKFAPVVIEGREDRRLVPRLWGVPPPPKIALEGGKPVYSARNLDSPFWIGTLRHREFRCLVPVTSFMEWGGLTGSRVQHWFSVPSEPVFAFAGIWRDSEVPSFAFLTCEPNPLVGAANAHSMPVILAPEDHGGWLGGDLETAHALACPFPLQLMLETRLPMGRARAS